MIKDAVGFQTHRPNISLLNIFLDRAEIHIHVLEVLCKELLYSVKKHHLSSEKSNFGKCRPLVPGLKSARSGKFESVN